MDTTGSPDPKRLGADAGKQATGADTPSEEVAISTFPLPAALCVVCGVILASATVMVLALGGISDRYHHHNADVAWHSSFSSVLVVQAATMELCFLISSWLATCIATPELWPKPPSDHVLRKHQFVDCMLTLLEYTIKLSSSIYLAQMEGVVMHLNPLVPFTRPVYLSRYVHWACAVPVLMLLTNRAFLGKHGGMLTLRRSAPSMALTSLYCIATWVTEVTSLNWGRWLLWGLILMGFVLASVDQVCAARSVPNAGRAKFGLLAYQLLAFTAYFCIYLLGYFGCIGFTREQTLLSYMDATLKVLQGSLLTLVRNYDDLCTMKHWWLESVAARRDFERLVKQARVPILAVDLQGRVTQWNESMTTLTGFAADKVIGLEAEEMVCAESRESVQQAMFRALRTEEHHELGPGPVEISVKRCAGEEPVNLVLSFVPRIARDGAVDGIVAIGQDLTELSEMKAVERQKAQLMAFVSHELRSPLHGMIGLTNMLEQQIEGAGVKRQLKMVRSCARRLLDLVTNIMDLSEAEQHQRKGLVAAKHQSKVNMLEVAQEVTVMTNLAVDKSGKPLVGPNLKLVNAMGELTDFPWVLGDSYKCTQLLYNLVTNACKFTNKGSVTLRARHVKESGFLEIDVEDTGVGIPEDAQQRIFQPFEQAKSGHSHSYQGMGLGLAVCFGIASAHGGSIGVRSKVGVGSTFTVRLPCEDNFVDRNTEDEGLIGSLLSQREHGASKQRPAEKAPQGDIPGQQPPANIHAAPQAAISGPSAPDPTGKASAPGRKPIILSVDDDEINQEVIENALAERYDLVRAMNGQEALEYLERCTKARIAGEGHKVPFPDVVLLDIQMPGLTGFDVLKELRHTYSGAHTELPVIMVSAKAPMELTATRSYSDGCTDFLAKPFNTGILEAKITVHIKIKEENRERSPREEPKAQIEQVEAKAKQAAEEAAAAREKAAAMERELGEARQAVEEAAAAREEAEAAKARTAALEDELSKVRQELGQPKAGEAKATQVAEEAAAAREEAKAAKAHAAAMAQELTKARQAVEEAAAAREEAKAEFSKAKATQVAEEAAAAREEAKAAKAHAAAMEQELTKARQAVEEAAAAREEAKAEFSKAAWEVAAAREEATAVKARVAAIEQELSRARQAAEEAVAREEAAKARAGTVEQGLSKARQAAEEEASAAREEAETAKAHAATVEQELSKVQQELGQPSASEAAAEGKAAAEEKAVAGRSAAAEEEVRRLRRDLAEARAALAAAQEAPAASGNIPPQARPARPARRPAMQLPAPRVQPPQVALGITSGDGSLVPWLYQQLQEREDEIVRLNGQLAARSSACELADQQMEFMMQAVRHSLSILVNPGDQSHPNARDF